MAMYTGENEQGLKKVFDRTRMIAIVVLLLHCYYNYYDAFKHWLLTSKRSDELLANISRTGILNGFLDTKFIALSFLFVSLLGVGQANGELAKQISERRGKTLQERESISINSSETSITRSKHSKTRYP